jgi:hypothetical protein
LTGPGVAPAVPSDIAHIKAIKAHVGLGSISPGFNALYDGISNGMEADLRLSSANAYQAQQKQQKYAVLSNMAQDPNTNMQDARSVLAWEPKVDPSTVFEKTYAQKFVGAVAGNDSATTMAALAQDAGAANDTMDIAEDTVTKQELFKTIIDDAEQYHANQGFIHSGFFSQFPTVGQTLKSLVGLNAIQKHNIVAETSSYLPGANMDEQMLYVWSRPPEEAAALVRLGVKKLQDKGRSDLAVEFAHAMLGQSEQQALAANVGVALDVG